MKLRTKLPDPPEFMRRLRLPLSARVEQYGVSPIIKQWGAWAVTTYGVECLVVSYAIAFDEVGAAAWQQPGLRVSLRSWRIQVIAFLAAMRYARKLLRGPDDIRPALRFRVLKRDGYRCQLCGRSAQDGVRLEVDHKRARSKGGPTTIDNLWTLCFLCNRGKGALPL